jgi:hypothetical protein
MINFITKIYRQAADWKSVTPIHGLDVQNRGMKSNKASNIAKIKKPLLTATAIIYRAGGRGLLPLVSSHSTVPAVRHTPVCQNNNVCISVRQKYVW